MYFTVFSLTTSILWVTVFTMIISLLRKQMFVMKHFSIYPLLILLAFNILRISFPIQLPFTVVVQCSEILPPIQSFFCEPFIDNNYIKINLAFTITLLWGMGAIMILIKQIREYHRFKHLLDFLPASEDARLYDLFAKANADKRLKHVKIIVHDSVESPAITGFIKPVIILPDIDFNDDELYGIFIHESTHYQFNHHWIKLAIELICTCFWWNPLIKKLSSEAEHALEMHSDKIVCSKTNYEQQKKYLKGIARVAENLHHPKTVQPCSCSLVAEKDKEKLQQRFKMVLEGNYQRKRKLNLIMIPVLLSVFVLSYTFVFQPYSEPTAEDLKGGILEDDDSSWYLIETEQGEASDSSWYLIKTEQGYDLYERSNRLIGHLTNVPDDQEAAMTTDSGTEQYSNTTGYKYKTVNEKLYKRLWSYTYNRWEESKWTLA